MPAPHPPTHGLPREGRSTQQIELDTCIDESELSAAGHNGADRAENVTKKNGVRTKRDRKRKTAKIREAETKAASHDQEDEATGVHTHIIDETAAAEAPTKKKGRNKHNNRKQKKKDKKNTKPAQGVATEANHSVDDNGHYRPSRGPPWNYAATQEVTYWDTIDGEPENPFSLGALNRRLTTEDRGRLPDNVELRTYIDHGVEVEGVFATAHIAAGTRILSERPLLVQPPSDEGRPIDTRLHEVVETFDALSPADQKTYMELSPGSALILAGFSREIDYLIKCYRFLQAKGDQRSEEENANYDSLGSQVSVLTREWRVGARFYRNSYAFPVTIGYQADGIPIKIIGRRVFANIARLKHSCVPNCWAHCNQSTGRMTVHATRDIAPGEELRVSALGSNHWYQTAAVRAKELAESLGIVCSCPACDPSHPDFERQEKIRGALNQQRQYVDGFVKAAQACDDEGRYRDFRNGVWVQHQLNLGTYQLVEKCTLEMLRWLQQLGCADVQWVELRSILKEIVYPKLELWYAVIAQGRKALADAERCMGDDNDTYIQLKRDVEDAEVWARSEQLEQDERRKAREKEEQARLEDQFRATVDFIINRVPGMTTILLHSSSTR